MKKRILVLLLSSGIFYAGLNSQQKPDYTKIDIMLAHAQYNKVIDTCRQIIATDSLNSEIYFKMGLAYQNLLYDDKSFSCFLRASAISPDNNLYRFMVAKGYYNKSINRKAKPLLESLSAADSMNWAYAYYLTSIYMQEGQYGKSIKIYKRFNRQDSTNYIFLDKLGFACLRQGDSEDAIDYFNKSLAINSNNTNAIKNVATLYAVSFRIDTAIQLLTRGIAMDTTDMDMYVRRAALYFSINYNKKALDDYLRILASGDSSFLYVKRAGIGYLNNLQPEKAILYLLRASRIDSTDVETLNYIARDYHQLKEPLKSAKYYNKIIKIMLPYSFQLGMDYILLAEEYKAAGFYKEAIANYLRSQDIRHDPSITMIMANLYDEKLNDIPKAIYYYERFINEINSGKSRYSSGYVDSIKKRIEALREKQKPAKATPQGKS